MEDLNWNKNYSVGVFEIDVEHKVFLIIIKKINKAFEKQLNLDFQKKLLEELYKYADFHFQSEENIMLMCAYPGYESHRKQHEELMQSLSEIINFMDIKMIDKKQLIDFLIQWFKEHTTSTDLELGTYLLENNCYDLLTEFKR